MPDCEPEFSADQEVETIRDHPFTHTRLPRYARGRKGRIVKILGFHVFPDKSASGEGDIPHWLYQVRFSAKELWGNQGDVRDSVTLDLWEPYFVKT